MLKFDADELQLRRDIHCPGGHLEFLVIQHRHFDDVFNPVTFCLFGKDSVFGRGGKTGCLNPFRRKSMALEMIQQPAPRLFIEPERVL